MPAQESYFFFSANPVHASRESLRLHYTSSEVEHVTPPVRADVHAAITASLEWDCPACIQDLIDREAIQTRWFRTACAHKGREPNDSV